MSLARKKQILAAGLIAFSLWPLAHLELVNRFGISPWKLGGWGMYATPRIAPGIGILVQRGTEEPAPMRVVPPELRVACENFATRRLWLRDLAPPDEIGRLVLASGPDYQRATVLILQPLVDNKTGMVRTEEKSYHYDRRAEPALPPEWRFPVPEAMVSSTSSAQPPEPNAPQSFCRRHCVPPAQRTECRAPATPIVSTVPASLRRASATVVTMTAYCATCRRTVPATPLVHRHNACARAERRAACPV